MTGEVWCSAKLNLAAKGYGEYVRWKIVVCFWHLGGLWTRIPERQGDLTTSGIHWR